MAGVTLPVWRTGSGFALPPVSEFAAKINDKTKAILLYGNPTGTVYALGHLMPWPNSCATATSTCLRTRCTANFATMEPSPNRGDFPVWRTTLFMDSVSKRYSMCGARIGAMVTKNKDVRKAAMKFAMARLSPPPWHRSHRRQLTTSDTYSRSSRALRLPQTLD